MSISVKLKKAHILDSFASYEPHCSLQLRLLSLPVHIFIVLRSFLLLQLRKRRLLIFRFASPSPRTGGHTVAEGVKSWPKSYHNWWEAVKILIYDLVEFLLFHDRLLLEELRYHLLAFTLHAVVHLKGIYHPMKTETKQNRRTSRSSLSNSSSTTSIFFGPNWMSGWPSCHVIKNIITGKATCKKAYNCAFFRPS